jgi:hypothetical protein
MFSLLSTSDRHRARTIKQAQARNSFESDTASRMLSSEGKFTAGGGLVYRKIAGKSWRGKDVLLYGDVS